MTQVKYEYPPNYDEICQHIPAVKKHPYIVFTYAPAIYSPAGIKLPPDLVVHEEVHIARQTKPAEWWQKYLTDIDFRLNEELEAYRAQYLFALEHYNRKERRLLLTGMTKDLSGEMYGKIITRKEAIKLITNGEKI
jgi:hypothetical protein